MPDNRKLSRKIIFLFNSFVTLSGGDVHLIEVAKRIRSFDKVIITSRNGKNLCECRGLDATFLITNEKDVFIKNIFLVYFIRIIKALYLGTKILDGDILYSSSDFLPDVFPSFIIKNRNKKCKWIQEIYHLIPSPTQRGGPFITNLISFFAQRVSLHLIRRDADLIFVLNNMIRSQLIKLGFSKNRIYIIGAGINLSQIDQIRQVEGVGYDACFLGRLHPAKGIFDLIEVWKLVVLKKKNARLAIIYVGPRDLELALTKRIREENIDSNVFMLPLKGEDALSVVKSSKVFVFPSHEEGWGIAVCEAMACGLPVVAYDLPVYREIFTQGIVTVPLKNIKRFSEEVVSLLENDEKGHVLGEKGMIQVSMYDWDSVAARELLLMKKELARE